MTATAAHTVSFDAESLSHLGWVACVFDSLIERGKLNLDTAALAAHLPQGDMNVAQARSWIAANRGSFDAIDAIWHQVIERARSAGDSGGDWMIGAPRRWRCRR